MLGGEGGRGCGSGSRGLIGLGLLGLVRRFGRGRRVCCLEMCRRVRSRWFWCAVRVQSVGGGFETYTVVVSKTVDVTSGRRPIVVVKVRVLRGVNG
jgi:hypothetical protein